MDKPDMQHTWRFVRLGGFDQVRLENPDDLRELSRLDQKLWVALACPTLGIEFDQRTLQLLDLDHDGRIRAPEVLEAVRWICAMLRDPSDIKLKSATLSLAQINADDPEAKLLLASARRILADRDKPEATEISVEDVRGAAKRFAKSRFNGDGIVPPAAAADDQALRAAIEEIIGCIGSETDGSGAAGLSKALLDKFLTEAQAFGAWWKLSEDDSTGIMPLGAQTPAGAALLHRLSPKIVDYFTRCRMAAFDPRAAELLNRSIDEYKELARRNLSAATPELAEYPLARVEAGRPLPLKAGINPAWADDVQSLRSTVVQPLLGELDELAEAQWSALLERFAGYRAWIASKAGAALEQLGATRVRALQDEKLIEQIRALIALDEAARPEAEAIERVERLVLYHRDLFVLLNNFVAFHDLYSLQRPAVFQVGTLYLDGRSSSLCLQVQDVAKHANMAVLSNIYLAYCLCTRPGSSETMQIVAGLTAGDSDFLAVGRNGLFYDHKGRDWDATVIKIIDNPISLRQAFFSPYKKAARFIGEQFAKFASSREKAVQDQLGSKALAVGQTATASKPAAAPAFDIARFAGIFAAIGLAVGAIGTAIAAVGAGFMGLRWWQMPLALIGLLLVISGPSILLAWLKLRHRNLAALLEAGGWAINAHVRISVPFGTSLTRLAKLPPQSELSLLDPYAPKKHRLAKWVLLILALLALAIAGVVFYEDGVLLNLLL